MQKKQFLEAGQIVNTHGIKGEVKIQSWCDSPEFLCGFKRLFIDGIEHKVSSARPHKDSVIAAIDGVEDVNTAMRYKSKIVYINRNDVKLKKGSWFIQDVIGLPVYTESGELLGELTEVMDMPAGPLYVVKGSEEHLIPGVPEFLKKVDTDAGRIIVSLIEGM